ncbi:MAG: PrsW family intramembrane metalloprotease [Paludibacteraceae bacterium]|nr:PrsW family intramembrane metalloprotease [Paludibacteraceae bacterium]
MNTLLIFIAAILPALALWLYVWKKDTQPEPASQLIKAILWGVAICIPVAFTEQWVQTMLFGAGGSPTSLFGTTAEAFFVAAIPEETAKLFVLWLILRKNPYFDEHYDGIVYAVCVGLGFAAVENFFYLYGQENWLGTAIGRALLSVPGHYAFAVLMGYYYSLYHFVERSAKNAVSILLVPVMAHGVYDALALSGSVNPLIGGISFSVLIYFCIKMQKEAQRKLISMVERDRK